MNIDDRIAGLEAEKNAVIASLNPGLSRLAFIDGQINTLQEMKKFQDETHARLQAENEALRAMADATLGGKSNGKLEPEPLPTEDPAVS